MDIRDKTWIEFMKIGRLYGCHQRPERSFSFKGYQFPVCARCTGIILGEFFAFLFVHRQVQSFKRGVFLIIPAFADGVIQLFKMQESNNARRFITGFLSGLGYVICIKSIVWGILKVVKENN